MINCVVNNIFYKIEVTAIFKSNLFITPKVVKARKLDFF